MGRGVKRSALICFAAFVGKGYSMDIGIKATSSKRAVKRFSLREIAPDNVTYFSEVGLPSLSNGANRKDPYGLTEENSLYTWSQISFRWKLNDKVKAMFNPRFTVNHNPDQETDQYQWEDPGFGINGTWFEKGNFSIGGNFDTILPIARTEESIEDGFLFNPGGWQSMNYQVNSKVSVGAWINARLNVYDRELTEDESALDLMVSPKISYAFNDKLSTTWFYQTNSIADKNSDFRMDQDDSLNFMASYTINDKLTIEPIFTVYRENDYKADDANVTVWISGTVF